MAKLYFRYGAMGSSKSANILMVRYNYEERGQYAVLLKPRTDNRDGEHEIKSRIGLEAPAEYVDEFLEEISKTWSADSGEYRYHGNKVDAILIDEAQFLLPEEVDTLSDIVDFYEIPVLCYGLRADFRTRLFPGSMRLMEIADVIEEAMDAHEGHVLAAPTLAEILEIEAWARDFVRTHSQIVRV